MIQAFLISLLFFTAWHVNAGLTAEDVLGEYWTDPLFGEAAESVTVHIDVLNGRMWPEIIKVPEAETIRFVFFNKSKVSHLFVFTNDIDKLMAKESFTNFIQDEIFHSQQEAKADPRSHSHTSSSVDEAEALVKKLDQRPTVFVKPNDVKEILVRFDAPEIIELSCVIDFHKEKRIKGKIEVFVNE
tara:strand:+ start:790 stop:1347 length:558 start_codon:yes stop_codon:yes gene_type:complete